MVLFVTVSVVYFSFFCISDTKSMSKFSLVDNSSPAFSAIVEGDTYDEIYEKVRRVISLNSDLHIWIASKDKL